MSINKKNVLDPAQARYLRKTRREEGLSSSSSSSSSPDPYLEKKAENIRNESIKSQIDYYGYVLEPFNMKNERGVGKLDDEGFYVFDHKKENEARDAWLDSLDQDPYHQGLVQNEENKLKALKGVWEEGSGTGIQGKEEGSLLEEEEDVKEREKEGEKIMEKDEGERKKDEILNREQLVLLVEELIGFMRPEELTSGLIKRMRPKEKKMQVFKKNIRKGVKKDEEGEKKKEKEEEKKQKEGEDQEKKDFLRVVEICDLLINNGFMGKKTIEKIFL